MKQRAPSAAEVNAQRRAALGGVPHRLPALRQEEKGEKLYVTVEMERPRWQRVLGADRQCERTFGLDAYGRRVYESCDGRRSVQRIVERFAGQVGVSVPEAELAVTRFMRTLMAKGLVAMEMEKPAA
jgi:hypothetical protein